MVFLDLIRPQKPWGFFYEISSTNLFVSSLDKYENFVPDTTIAKWNVGRNVRIYITSDKPEISSK